MMISSSEEKSLPQKLSEDIIAFILKENLQPGDKLPNETVLSERLNAGRSSVREAMKLLASRNIVTIRQGSGTYIASSPGMVEDPLGLTFIGNKQKLIHDLLEVRFLLEPSIAAMAATRANKKDIKKITTLCDDVEALLKKHVDHTQKDIEFHTAIALSSKNVVVPRLIPRKSFTSLLEEHIRIILISGKRYQPTELVDPGRSPALQNAFAQFTV